MALNAYTDPAVLKERVKTTNAYATKPIATRARTWASAPGSPTMPAMIAGPMMTPAVGP